MAAVTETYASILPKALPESVHDKLRQAAILHSQQSPDTHLLGWCSHGGKHIGNKEQILPAGTSLTGPLTEKKGIRHRDGGAPWSLLHT